MLFKVSAFHVYSHHNDSSVEQCSICDVAIHNQNAELSTSPQTVLPNNLTAVFVYKRPFTIVSSFPTHKVCRTLYGRPPPSLD